MLKTVMLYNAVHTISSVVLVEIKKLWLLGLFVGFLMFAVNKDIFLAKCLKGCIRPIYKEGSHHSMENYGPVCAQFKNIFEKVLHIGMINYINKYNILSISEFGFQASEEDW